MSHPAGRPLYLIGCGLALALLPQVASGYCIGWDKTLPDYDPAYYSVSHEFIRAKYVVLAKVVRETWLGEDGKPKPLEPPFQDGAPRPWGFDPYAGAYYDVRVETAFKGSPPPQLRLFSENSTARFPLDVGGEWLLFVTDDTVSPPEADDLTFDALTVDNCGNSKALAHGKALLRRLRELAASSG